MMKSRPLGWHAFANLSYDGCWEMRVWAFGNANLGSVAVVSDPQVLSEYKCGAQCVCVCVCVYACAFVCCHSQRMFVVSCYVFEIGLRTA